MKISDLIVFVYRNLNRKGVVFSIKDIKSGLVVDRREIVVIKNPLFKVSKAGRARILRTKSRVVHAGIQGKVLGKLPANVKGLKKVSFSYNPFKNEHFTDSKGKHLVQAKYVVLSAEGLYAYI